MRTHSAARSLLLASALVAAAACAGDGDVKWVESGGEVGLRDSSYRRLDYEVTSERYRKWIAANRALDGVEIGEPVDVDLRHLTNDDIERVETTLENHAAARESIKGAGMTVHDFVLTTIALAQPWAEANPSLNTTVNVANPGPTVARRAVPPAPPVLSDGQDDDSDRDSDRHRHRKKGKKH